MKHYHSIVVTILLVLLTGCATTSTPQFRQVSPEEAFSDIRALAKDKSQSHPEEEHLYTQPANKSAPCKLSTSQDQLDRNNFRSYWDGECKDGFAYGLGRGIAISDTHHIEGITIYGDNGKMPVSPWVKYDFVHQVVIYGLTDDKGAFQYGLQEKITNEGGKFYIKYTLSEHTENGDNFAIWSPFRNTGILVSDSENVYYQYKINKININNRTPTLHFQTLDTKTGSPIGFEMALYANGKVVHAKVDNSELVKLPKEYVSMVDKKYQELLEFNSRVSNELEKAKRMEKEYLYLACNGKHEISGLEKGVSNKICTWREQFKEPFELAQKKYNESLEKSLERMQTEARTQQEQQRIQQEQQRIQNQQNQQALENFNRAMDSFGESMDSISGYTSSTGSTYEYDLSNPSDRVQYGADPAAQLRDRIDPNPLRRIERNTGQYGGGVLNNNNSPQWNWVD